MPDYNEKLAELQQRLDKMNEYQGYFNSEIGLIQSEINALKRISIRNEPAREAQQRQQTAPPPIQPTEPQFEQPRAAKPTPEPQVAYTNQTQETPAQKSGIEEFVGKNIISLIGVIITIIGVAIGAKYAIDNNLISPLTRIVFGYIVGFGLIGFAIKLKEKYHNFSAVLLSGGMATMYFITYFAYSYYNLITQISAFSVMVIFTIFTVLAAINYNRQVIAVIGLVGAYAVPFLISEGSGRVDVLFSYMALINIGILAVSVKKYWRYLLYSSFNVTWIIFIAWFVDKYRIDQHFFLAFAFATIFFLIFYAAIVAYKLLHKEEFSVINIVLLLLNSLLYFGLGATILADGEKTKELLGLFTLANCILHFGVSYLVSQVLATKKTLYFVIGLSLFFLTIAVPIQLEGHWTPIFWTIEAVFLFWVGYTKRIDFYEVASYCLMIFATFALFVYLQMNQADWTNYYYNINKDSILTLVPFFNKPFIVGSIFAIGFGIICYLLNFHKNQSTVDSDAIKLIKVIVSTIFVVALYNVFRTEIGNYWHFHYVNTAYLEPRQYTGGIENSLVFDNNLSMFNVIWQINYTMLFLTILSFVNIKWLKNTGLGFASLALNIFVLSIFSIIGLYFISKLRESYLLQSNAERFARGISHISVRYFSLAFAFGLILASYQLYKQEFLRKIADVMVIFDLAFAVIFWIILSSELLNILDFVGYQDSYKLALSLLWGAYSLGLIALGILWRKTHLRIGAMALFGLTLAKLFLYDLSSLSTISKTIVFVTLGIMLLIISFLYNKYKKFIFVDE